VAKTASDTPPTLMLHRLLIVALVMLGATAGALAWMTYTGALPIPARWNPWAPLDVSQPPGPLTAWRLWRATHDPALCATVLASTGLQYRPIPDSIGPGGCALQNVVRIERAQVSFNHSFLASCPLALGVALFERQYLQPAAQAVYGEPVTQITHVGSYACRNIDHEKVGELSEHATANALDITGFILADGTRVSIEHDWGAASPAAAFLQQVHAGACAVFHVVLGPDYNGLHRTHFHVDMGRYSVCR
jgi:hypothetical protein